MIDAYQEKKKLNSVTKNLSQKYTMSLNYLVNLIIIKLDFEENTFY